MMLAGADAVAMGTVMFNDPTTPVKALAELNEVAGCTRREVCHRAVRRGRGRLMTTTVYIIRHAEAEGNVYRRCHGQYDALLDPRVQSSCRIWRSGLRIVPLLRRFTRPTCSAHA